MSISPNLKSKNRPDFHKKKEFAKKNPGGQIVWSRPQKRTTVALALKCTFCYLFYEDLIGFLLPPTPTRTASHNAHLIGSRLPIRWWLFKRRKGKLNDLMNKSLKLSYFHNFFYELKLSFVFPLAQFNRTSFGLVHDLGYNMSNLVNSDCRVIDDDQVTHFWVAKFAAVDGVYTDWTIKFFWHITVRIRKVNSRKSIYLPFI